MSHSSHQHYRSPQHGQPQYPPCPRGWGSDGSGSITCRILRNGEEVTSSTSSGPYAVVTCSGGL